MAGEAGVSGRLIDGQQEQGCPHRFNTPFQHGDIVSDHCDSVPTAPLVSQKQDQFSCVTLSRLGRGVVESKFMDISYHVTL